MDNARFLVISVIVERLSSGLKMIFITSRFHRKVESNSFPYPLAYGFNSLPSYDCILRTAPDFNKPPESNGSEAGHTARASGAVQQSVV